MRSSRRPRSSARRCSVRRRPMPPRRVLSGAVCSAGRRHRREGQPSDDRPMALFSRLPSGYGKSLCRSKAAEAFRYPSRRVATAGCGGKGCASPLSWTFNGPRCFPPAAHFSARGAFRPRRRTTPRRRSRFRPSACRARGAPSWWGVPCRARGRRRLSRAGC